MGIKSYNPYTPSRRHMTGSDFSEITKIYTREISYRVFKEKRLDVTTRVRLQLDTAEAEAEENTESSTSREEKMEFLQQ